MSDMNKCWVGSSKQGYPILGGGAIYGTIQNWPELQTENSPSTPKK